MEANKGKFIFLTAKDVIRILECSERQANRELRALKDLRKKNTKRKPTLREFCDYYELDYIETKSIYF